MVEIGVVVVILYVLMLATLFVVQRKLIYFPDRSAPVPADHGVPEMSIVRLATEDGLELAAWYRAPAGGGGAVVVYFHGNAGHIGGRGDKVRPYLDAGYGVLLLGYRAYGGNPGKPSEQGLYSDARAALGFLAGEGVASERLVLYGESLGTGVAVRMASERRVAAVVLEAPFTSATDVGAARFPFAPVRLLARDRFDSLSRIAAVGAPVLVLHGERDTTIPVAFGRRLLAAAVEPKEGRFYPGAGHADLYDFGAAEAVIDFLARHGARPRPIAGCA